VLAYLGRRLLLALITVWAITVVTFVIVELPPGDFASAYITGLQAQGVMVTEADAVTLREEFGLDDPVHLKYFKWVRRVAQGNFGMSMEWRRPVAELIGDRLLLTAVVSIAAILFTWLVALPIGVYSAVRQYTLGDYVFTLIGFVGLAVPSFLIGLVLMYLGFSLFGASIGGLFSPEYQEAPWSPARAWDLAKHLPLPAVVLGLGGTAGLIRIMRANLLDELRKPYVVTARAKGMRARDLILKYPVRVALNPFASTIGYLFPHVVSGSIIVSLVLGLPTVGPLLLRALVSQDMYLAATIILMLGVMTVVGTLVSDLILLWVDPRIRLEGR
jgi:peptide/nickel transport system permease protein